MEGVHRAVKQQLASRRGGVPDIVVGFPEEPLQVVLGRFVDARLKVEVGRLRDPSRIEQARRRQKDPQRQHSCHAQATMHTSRASSNIAGVGDRLRTATASKWTIRSCHLPLHQ